MNHQTFMGLLVLYVEGQCDFRDMQGQFWGISERKGVDSFAISVRALNYHSYFFRRQHRFDVASRNCTGLHCVPLRP